MPYVIKKTRKRERFQNVHKNYKLPYRLKGQISNDDQLSDPKAYNDTSLKIKTLIGFALDNKVRLRPYGSKWSLSRAPYGKDLLLKYDDLKIKRFLSRRELSIEADTNEYLFAQSGNLIEDLSLYCQTKGRSLQTSGASNGQTIAGAIGTGVHGSAIHIGAIQDGVVGLHIIVDRDRSVYLEAEDNPIVQPQFVKKIGAELIQDNELFYAALVSLGAFGFVHGVMLQTVPLFLLKNYVMPISKRDAFQLAKSLNFKNSNFKIPGEGDRPYHLKLYINQYNIEGRNGIKAEIMYAYRPQRGFFKNLIDYFKDIPKILGKFSEAANCTVPALIKIFEKVALPKDGLEMGHLNDIFHKTKIRGSQFSTAFAVPVKDSVKALELMIQIIEDSGRNIPSIFSMRFVKRSKATLAFTKHKMNCVLGIDGLQSKDMTNYVKLLHEALDHSGISYAWHWGKVTNMDAPMVDRMYGSAKKKWLKQRDRLLVPEVKEVFNNEYLERLGLAQ